MTADPHIAEGRAFLIEWNGQKLDGLAVLKRGKVVFRTADNRLLGRATVISQLTRPGEQSSAPTREERSPAQPVGTGALDSESAERSHAGSVNDSSRHWAAAAPPVVTPQGSMNRDPVVAPEPAEQPRPAEPAAEAAPVRRDGDRWLHAASGEVIWEGPVRVADVDRELAAAQHRVATLTALRALVNSERDQAIADVVVRLAAADGVVDLSTASDSQLDSWNRYAAAMVGE